MKKTASEFISTIKKYIKASALFTDVHKPNGIVASKRLDNSETEDVIVNSSSLGFEQVQDGMMNINLYVKNLHMRMNPSDATSGFDDSQPDDERIAYLDRILTNVIMNYDDLAPDNSDGYSITLQQVVHLDAAENWTCLNYRIEVTAVTP